MSEKGPKADVARAMSSSPTDEGATRYGLSGSASEEQANHRVRSQHDFVNGHLRRAAVRLENGESALHLRKANGCQCEHVAWLHVAWFWGDLQPAVILRIHEASGVISRATAIFKESISYIANLERISGIAVSRFENVQDGPG
jgi:hypothetical protein